MTTVAQMKKFMEPESVALIGVSRRTGADAFNILENLLACGYQGRIYPINPNASEVLGVKAYPSVGEVTDDIDLAVINLPRDLVPGRVKECINKGIEAIIIVTQGFADADDEKGKQLQREIDELVKGNRVRILGPNTFGIANAYTNFSSAYTKMRMRKIPVGLVSQTGFFFADLSDLNFLGKGIDLGNSCDIGFVDGLEYFEQDVDTKVIGLHIEGMKDGKPFLGIANRVAHKKPVVALKTGRSPASVKAAQSHTGSLVGKDELWEVAFKQSGIIRVGGIEEFGDTLKVCYTLPLMSGRRIAIATWTGGVGIMSVDACHRAGLQLSQLSPITIERLNAVSPSWQRVGNPADIWPTIMVAKQPTLQTMEGTIRNLLCDPCVDAVLCICAVLTRKLHSELCQRVQQITEDFPSKPLVFYLYGSSADEARAELEKTGKALAFRSPDRALTALGHLADYSEFRKKF